MYDYDLLEKSRNNFDTRPWTLFDTIDSNEITESDEVSVFVLGATSGKKTEAHTNVWQPCMLPAPNTMVLDRIRCHVIHGYATEYIKNTIAQVWVGQKIMADVPLLDMPKGLINIEILRQQTFKIKLVTIVRGVTENFSLRILLDGILSRSWA